MVMKEAAPKGLDEDAEAKHEGWPDSKKAQDEQTRHDSDDGRRRC